MLRKRFFAVAQNDKCAFVTVYSITMVIGLDAFWVSHLGGLGSYVRNLVRELTNVGPSENCNVWSYVTRGSAPVLSEYCGTKIESVELPKEVRGNHGNTRSAIVWMEDVLPSALGRRKLDVFHGLVHLAPRQLSCPTVVTVHDLIFLRCSRRLLTEDQWEFLAVRGRKAADEARLVICVSQHAKHDLMDLWGVDEERIRVVYLAASPTFQVLDGHEVQSMLADYDLPKDFLLYVGGQAQRKNLLGLIRARRLLRDDYRIDIPLVIVTGNQRSRTGPFLEGVANTLGIRERVILLGWLPEEALAALYNAATVFIYPSLYEGFGLPVLEAMACGVPVVTSRCTATKEIAAEAAALVNPYDIEEMAYAIYKIVTDSTLRVGLRELGLKRAATFSWRKTAYSTLAVYHEVLEV